MLSYFEMLVILCTASPLGFLQYFQCIRHLRMYFRMAFSYQYKLVCSPHMQCCQFNNYHRRRGIFKLLRQSQLQREPSECRFGALICNLQLANSMAEHGKMIFKSQDTCCRDDLLQPWRGNSPARLFASEIDEDNILAQGHS